MKNFTRLVAAIALTSVAFGASAQADLQLNSFRISSAAGNQVPPGHTTIVSYTIMNSGNVVIPANSVFIRTVSKGTVPVVGPDNITMQAALNPGDSITYTASGAYTFTESAFENICVSTFLDTAIIETDTSNNLLCESVQISSSISSDIGIINATIVSPTNLDGHDLNGGKDDAPDIGEFSFQMVNFGDINYIGGSYGMEVYIENDIIAAVANPGTLAPGDTSAALGTTEATLIPETPQEKGIYEFCVRYTDGDDNSENDRSCTTFELVDLFVPPPPPGIEEGANSNLSIYYNTQNLVVSGILDPVNIVVTDAQGKLVTSTTMSSDGVVNMNNPAAGMYVIVATNSSTGEQSAHKVSVQ